MITKKLLNYLLNWISSVDNSLITPTTWRERLMNFPAVRPACTSTKLVRIHSLIHSFTYSFFFLLRSRKIDGVVKCHWKPKKIWLEQTWQFTMPTKLQNIHINDSTSHAAVIVPVIWITWKDIAGCLSLQGILSLVYTWQPQWSEQNQALHLYIFVFAEIIWITQLPNSQWRATHQFSVNYHVFVPYTENTL